MRRCRAYEAPLFSNAPVPGHPLPFHLTRAHGQDLGCPDEALDSQRVPLHSVLVNQRLRHVGGQEIPQHLVTLRRDDSGYVDGHLRGPEAPQPKRERKSTVQGPRPPAASVPPCCGVVSRHTLVAHSATANGTQPHRSTATGPQHAFADISSSHGRQSRQPRECLTEVVTVVIARPAMPMTNSHPPTSRTPPPSWASTVQA